ncbi:hypothetical protein Q5O24_07245 [Eubacteriaceae bacterium ES3]|nr:hypothetical protein Q5O24_07245 [Eubacteriaceae bacterium ES3]
MNNLAENQIKYELYREFIRQELITIDSMFELFIYLKNQHSKRLEVLNLSPAFFSLTENALYEGALIRLCRLYDYDDKTITFRKYLNYIEQNTKMLFNTEDREKVKIALNADKNQLDLFDCKLIEFKKIRDKLLAHNDMGKLKEDDIFKGTGLVINDVRNLIQFGMDCVNHYSNYYDGQFFSIKATNNFDVDVILSILKKSKQNH